MKEAILKTITNMMKMVMPRDRRNSIGIPWMIFLLYKKRRRIHTQIQMGNLRHPLLQQVEDQLYKLWPHMDKQYSIWMRKA